MKLRLLFLVPFFALMACAGKPLNVSPVSEFEADRYLGTWYEIARLDHVFERGLSNVTAQYSKRDDGQITALNRGYNEKKNAFDEAEGKAKFATDASTGFLKVSFFGPFYGDYIVFGLDKIDYSYAYISGGNDDYLWLLSRTPMVSQTVRQDFIRKSKALGYDTDSLIWVDQNRARQ